MAMPVEKAKNILKSYKETNYNAKEALTSLGYTSTSARTRSGEIIDTAVRTLARAGEENQALEFLGMTRKEIASEYRKIITQDKHYSSKLRALEPLLKPFGIQWDEQKVQVTPTLNIGVIERKKEIPMSKGDDSDNVAQYMFGSGDSKKPLNTGINDVVSTSPRPDSSINDEKERDSQLQNFSEKVTIDKSEEVSQNIEKEGESKVYETLLEPVGSEDEVDFIESLNEENQ